MDKSKVTKAIDTIMGNTSRSTKVYDENTAFLVGTAILLWCILVGLSI